MKLSVIIPMFNEAGNIGRTLLHVRRAADLAAIDHEIIVVDNGSSDIGPALAASAGAQVISAPHINISALRNLGVARSDGEWLAFLDADMEVPDNWLLLWLACVDDNRADLMALVHAVPKSAPWFARIWGHRILAQRNRAGFYQFLPSSNLCLSRALFIATGGFDERLITGEDKDLTLRLHAAGARLLSLPEPVALHWGYERTFSEWVRKEFWRQTGHGSLLRKCKLGLRTLRFPALAVGHWVVFAGALALFLTGQPWWALAIVLLGGIPTLLMSARHRLNRQANILPRLWLLHWLRQHIGGLAVVYGMLNSSVKGD